MIHNRVYLFFNKLRIIGNSNWMKESEKRLTEESYVEN